jgi:hypothetical protein
MCGQSDISIDYATARRRKEPIPTAITESTCNGSCIVGERATANAVDAPRCASEAQGSMRGNERHPRAGSCGMRKIGPWSLSARGMTPRFEMVSDPYGAAERPASVGI